MTMMPELTSDQRSRTARIAESFLRLTGRPLVEDRGDIVLSLWEAPMAIVAHETAPDPVFFFGNRAALSLFEMTFADFTRLPSRLSAESMLREDRERLLERVRREGIITDYAGVRISSTGRRFRIKDASVWNLIDADGQRHGQAAAFAHWTPV